MWVRLKTIQHIERQGKMHVYHPGDWIDVGKQTAMLWLSRNDAEIPTYKRETFVTGEAGVVINADKSDPYMTQFDQTKLVLILLTGQPYIAFNKTLCWSPAVPLRPELVGVGFSFLDTWEMAVPIFSYDELAIHMGSNEDRENTRAVIRDLRVPVYDTRLIFVKPTASTKRLFDLWNDEREKGGDERLSFMRAYYEVKPLLLALPVTWHTPNAYSDAA